MGTSPWSLDTRATTSLHSRRPHAAEQLLHTLIQAQAGTRYTGLLRPGHESRRRARLTGCGLCAGLCARAEARAGGSDSGLVHFVVVCGVWGVDDLHMRPHSQTCCVQWRQRHRVQGGACTWWPCLMCVLGTSSAPAGSPVAVWKPCRGAAAQLHLISRAHAPGAGAQSCGLWQAAADSRDGRGQEAHLLQLEVGVAGACAVCGVLASAQDGDGVLLEGQDQLRSWAS